MPREGKFGGTIRAARRVQGWSQAELATKLGVSQSLISRIERGLQALTPPQERRLLRLLGTGVVRRALATATVVPAIEPVEPRFPRLTGRVPLKIVEWQRRRPSGDFMVAIPSRNSVLLVLGDVAGNGPRVAGLAHYVKGWLRGAVGTLERGASMQIVEDLDAELRTTEIDLAYFLAVVRREEVQSHRVTLEYVRRGMVAPLLFQGHPTASRALDEASGLVQVGAPWRLVAPSDGLLQRLGVGDETEGVRQIARWQASEQRDQPAASRFGSGGDGAIDESLWIVEWYGWDWTFEIDARSHSDRRATHGLVRGFSGGDSATAVAELVGNSVHHGYGAREGTIWVRARREDLATCIEVEDRGTGGLTQATIDSSRNGLAVVRGIASHVSTRNVYPTGTIVTAVFPRGEIS